MRINGRTVNRGSKLKVALNMRVKENILELWSNVIDLRSVVKEADLMRHRIFACKLQAAHILVSNFLRYFS